MPSIEGLKSAADVSKQVITLATGVTTVSITFWDKFHGLKTPAAATVVIGISWLSFVLSIAFALWVLMAITGTLTMLDRKADGSISPSQSRADYADTVEAADPLDAYGSNIQLPATGMVVCFAAGLLLSVIAAFINAAFSA